MSIHVVHYERKPLQWQYPRQSPARVGVIFRGTDFVMSMRDRIETKLKAEFSPQELVITDMSAQHSGHAGARPEGESHFHVKLVSASFLGKPSVSRQRMVYAALAQELEEGVHALSLTTLAPGEKS